MFTRASSKVFGGTMLIAGTSIGAAVLAMPILTGLFGFLGTVAIMIACWLFMYWTAILILESSLYFKNDTSFLGMAKATLGPIGSTFTWICFLLLFYSLVAAYLSGCGGIITDALEIYFSIKLPPFFDLLPLLVLFAPFLYFGLAAVDKLNRLLMIGMFIAYAAINIWLIPKSNFEYLSYTNWSFSLLSFSVVVTSFGYHVIIPTLVSYLDRDIKSIKQCLFYGSLIPLLFYFLWELSVLGAIPVSGANGLAQAFSENLPLAKLLRVHTNTDLIATMAQLFSVFAIVTSFLGVAQGLFDFLKDGFKAYTNKAGKPLAFIMTFLPPVILILAFESGFFALLDYAGALVSIILGIIPILMTWRLRQRGPNEHQFTAPGKSFGLVLGIIFFSLIVFLVLAKNLGYLQFDSALLWQ